MRSSDLLERLQQAGPFANLRAAERSLEAVLRVLATAVPTPLRRALREVLPGEYAHLLDGASSTRAWNAASFDEHVADTLGVEVGLATEHVEVVCAVLGASVDPELRSRLQAGFDPVMGERFAGRSYPKAPSHVQDRTAHSLATARSGGSHSLSEAAPGSQHPVSSARPRGPQPGSVASETNPHARTKLSSAHGTTQEREHETLAEGRNPGRE